MDSTPTFSIPEFTDSGFYQCAVSSYKIIREGSTSSHPDLNDAMNSNMIDVTTDSNLIHVEDTYTFRIEIGFNGGQDKQAGDG